MSITLCSVCPSKCSAQAKGLARKCKGWQAGHRFGNQKPPVQVPSRSLPRWTLGSPLLVRPSSGGETGHTASDTLARWWRCPGGEGLPGDGRLGQVQQQAGLGQAPAPPLAGCVASTSHLSSRSLRSSTATSSERPFLTTLSPGAFPSLPPTCPFTSATVLTTAGCYRACLPAPGGQLHDSKDFFPFGSLLYLQDLARCWHIVGAQ